MSADVADGELAVEIVNPLIGSGLSAIPDLDEDGHAWIALVLDEHAGIVAWLYMADLSHAVLVHPDGRRTLEPRGPLVDVEPCRDGRCVAGGIVEWVLSLRAGAGR